MYLQYYVYAYLRKDSTPYYIGKGKDTRAWDRHKNIPVPTDPKYITILESNLTELGALAIERRMIFWYGRKDLGTGILRNMAEGGTGGSLSPLSKQKISQKNKGKTAHNKGKPMGEEQRLKITEQHRNRSIETCKKISMALTGRKAGPETRAKQSAAGKGKTQTAEWIEKRIAGKRGKPNLGASQALKGISKPRPVSRLVDRKEMSISNFIQWCNLKDKQARGESHPLKGRAKSAEHIAKRTASRLKNKMVKTKGA
jgi:hypothetical protein